MWAGQTIYRYDEIDSTNLEAKRLGMDGAPHGSLVVAKRQSAGRGRRGRNWESAKEGNLYFSLLLRPDFEPEKASMLTLVMALAVVKALGRVNVAWNNAPLGCDAPGIKWPNDIVIAGKKLAGILTEMDLLQDGTYQVIIGVGINLVKQDFSDEVADKAISLEQVTGTAPDAETILADIMDCFENCYEQLGKDGDLSGLKDDYENYLVNRGRMVRVLDPKGEYEGKALGINEEGHLLVETMAGCDGQETGEKEVKEVYAGEVSVRGIYGYV